MSAIETTRSTNQDDDDHNDDQDDDHHDDDQDDDDHNDDHDDMQDDDMENDHRDDDMEDDDRNDQAEDNEGEISREMRDEIFQDILYRLMRSSKRYYTDRNLRTGMIFGTSYH